MASWTAITVRDEKIIHSVSPCIQMYGTKVCVRIDDKDHKSKKKVKMQIKIRCTARLFVSRDAGQHYTSVTLHCWDGNSFGSYWPLNMGKSKPLE